MHDDHAGAGAPERIPTEVPPDHTIPGGAMAFMAQNPVAANLLMLVLAVGGVVMMSNVRQEVFPDVSPDVVNIVVPYPGASPSEVEQGVILVIEEALSDVDGIKRVTATAVEGSGSVAVELTSGTDKNVALQDVQAAVNRIISFPQDAERPTVSLASRSSETVSIIYYGDVGERVLRDIAERARDELLQDERITDVEVTEVRPLEISIEVPEENLRRYGMTLNQVSSIVSQSSIELPAGAVDTPRGEVLVRTDERRDYGEQYADIALISSDQGSRVRLGDVANVIDGFRDTDTSASFNGLPASRVRVFRAGDQTPIELSDATYEFLERTEGRLPPGVEAAVWFDRSESYRDRINLLLRNAYIGLALVLLVLGAFLQIKLAFWVTLGIPISFLGAITLMPSMDVSFNMISLFAFILTLGIVVDDAIVVGESIYHQRVLGLDGVKAAIEGVREVAYPVIFSVSTTIIAFLPMLFVPGTMGRFMRNIPLIVIAVFLLSIIESLYILPAHLAHSHEKQTWGFMGFMQRLQRLFSAGLDWFIRHVYARTLRPIVRARYLTLAVALAGLIVTAGFVAAGHVKFTFLPKVESDLITASIRMPFGTPPEHTEQILDRMVEVARDIMEENGGEDAISRGIYSAVGTGGESFGPGGGGATGGHAGNASVFLVALDKRDITAAEFSRQWRERIGEVPGAEMLSFRFSTGPSGGAPISVRLSHADVDILESNAERLAEHLATYSGVIDIDSGVSLGKEQLDLELTELGRAQGLTQVDLARQVRAAFFGDEAVRQQRGRDEVRVYVRRPEAERDSEYFLETMVLRTPTGGEIPLAEAATADRGRAYTSISRVNSRRVVTVTADVNENEANAAEVAADLEATFLPQLMADVPGLSYEFGGEQESRAESIGALRSGMQVALMAMFALMAIAFRSYIQPIIIMSAIPFGVVGAVIGHMMMGYSVSMLSLFGIVALSGVVVNDSLLLVVAINSFYRDKGMSLYDAVVEGGVRRFRPIMMTSLTTFFGLAPMILETSVQARFLIPMAISLGFGVLFVTFITLVLVPSLYLVVEDLKRVFLKIVSALFEDDEPSIGAAE